MLIDSHCHVLSEEYDNAQEVIENSFLSGVNKIIISAYDLKSSKEAVEFAKKYDNVYATVGFSPENVNGVTKDDINEISKLAKDKKVIAIGEIGLDYYWTKENKEQQINIFKKMLDIAKINHLPVIVHNREATLDVYSILKESKLNGIIHCFSGSVQTANDFIKLGFLIGIGGVITFKNAKKLKEVVESIPLSCLSLETDSPYLTPEPYRGKKNDPSKVIYVAKKIAEIKGTDIGEVISKTGSAVCLKFDLK